MLKSLAPVTMNSNSKIFAKGGAIENSQGVPMHIPLPAKAAAQRQMEELVENGHDK